MKLRDLFIVILLLTILLFSSKSVRAITSTNKSPVFVPYTGANSDLNLGNYNLTVANSLRLGVNKIMTAGDGRITLTGTEVFSVFLNWQNLKSNDRTYFFPDKSGTFGLLEADQNWTGINKFKCIAMEDSDGNGLFYLTINSGTLSISSTKPAFCQ